MLPETLSRHWVRYQPPLFPHLHDSIEPLTDRHREVILVLDVLRLERFMFDGPRAWTGRRPSSRLAIARSLVAKAVLNLPSTKALLDRLRVDAMLRRICGYESVCELPSEGTFSNAFAELAQWDLLSRVHESLVKKSLDGCVVGHVSRDATDIRARERGVKKTPGRRPKKPHSKYGPGRPRNGEVRTREPSTRIEKQMQQSLDDMLAELPMACDVGSKRGSSGHLVQWVGYKLHMDVDDNSVPLSCLLTSASLNDSQVAIPLEKITQRRVTSLYTVLDKGYDCENIRVYIRSQGKVPLMETIRRRGQQEIPMEPATAARYRIRTSVERAFSELKDNLGCRQIRVRGAPKVMAHVMCGVLALTALGLLQYWA